MRRLRKLLGWLILIVLLVYGGSNLWLSSPRVKEEKRELGAEN